MKKFQAYRLLMIFIFEIGVLVFFTSCASQKMRLPIEEIRRPLSLPPENWRIGAGAGTFFNSDNIQKPSLDLDAIFTYPYFQFGTQLEYYLPATFKYYIAKNIEIKDSVMSINGLNCAISAGLIGWSFTSIGGSVLTFTANVDCKKPVNNKLWLLSKLLVNYKTNRSNDFMSDFAIGIGYQISEKFYAIISPTVYYNNYMNFPYENNYNINLINYYGLYFINNEGFNWTIPIVLGANLTNTMSVYWRTKGHFHLKGSTQFSSALGVYITF